MGVHADLLEPCWCTAQLLPLLDLPRQSSTFGLPLESHGSQSPLHLLPVRLLGLGYCQCTKESIQTVGTRHTFQQKDISSTAVANPGQPEDYPDRPGRRPSRGWLVYVDYLWCQKRMLISMTDGMARKIHYTCDLYFVSDLSLSLLVVANSRLGLDVGPYNWI